MLTSTCRIEISVLYNGMNHPTIIAVVQAEEKNFFMLVNVCSTVYSKGIANNMYNNSNVGILWPVSRIAFAMQRVTFFY